MMNHCDYGHETEGEVRLLPHGTGNNIVCRHHYQHEMAVRFQNIVQDNIAEDMPTWTSLKVYGEEE